jgi:hypothetical protein
MTYYLGWSTHHIYDDQWRCLAQILRDGDASFEGTYTWQGWTYREHLAPYRQLVDMGILARDDWHPGRFELTMNGKRFVEELLPDRFRASPVDSPVSGGA